MNYTGTDFYIEREYESKQVLAYHHTKPHWPVHIVVVPKKHIDSLLAVSETDTPILLEIFDVLKMLGARIEKEYGAARILTNLGTYQDSKHLHFHVCSGEPV